MADVILFRPKAYKGETRLLNPRPPLGLLFVAAPLVKNHFKVKIIDQETNFNWLEDLSKELDSSTICVGVSAMTGMQILGGLEFAKIVKEKFNLPVVWGGLHPSALPEQTIKNTLVDIVVKGEGENSFLNIVDALKHGGSLGNIANVWWKENGSVRSNAKRQFVDLNNLPPLPYHLIECEKYIKIKRNYFPDCKRTFELNTDRGCPHRCGFCYNFYMNDRKWRGLSALNVIEKIEGLVKEFSLDGINFIGDNFFVDKNRVADICNEIVKRRINISWHADCRIDYFVGYEDSFIDLLKKSGCRTMTFGIESGSQRVLDLIHKDINIGEVFKVNNTLKQRQIAANYHFMVGFPGETKKDVLETYKNMLKLQEEFPSAIFFGPTMYTPYPGTPLYDTCLEMGFVPPERLADWAEFRWNEKTNLPFAAPHYSKWLKKTANIVQGISVNFSGLRWLKRWFRLRAKLIVKFDIIGPQPEIKLFLFLRKIISFFLQIGGRLRCHVGTTKLGKNR